MQRLQEQKRRLLWKIFFIVLGLGLVLAFKAMAEESGPGAYTFDQAIQNYLKGDSQAAIQQLDESLRLDPNNQRAKVFLLKILVERGSRLFLAKQYQKAYDYLSRAYHMDSENQQVRQMFDIASKQVLPQTPVTKVMLIPKSMQEEMLKQEAAERTQAQGAPNVTLAEKSVARSAGAKFGGAANAVYAEPAPMEAAPAQAAAVSSAFINEYAKNASAMMNLLSTFQTRQEQQLAQFMVPLDRLQRIYYQSEQDRKHFINQLDGRFKSILGNVSFQQRMVIYGFAFGLLILGLVVWGFYMIIGRMRSRREETIMKYQQEMLKMVRDMAALPGGNTYANALPSGMGYPLRLAPANAPQLMSTPQAATGVQNIYDPLSQLEEIIRTGNYKERSLAAMQILNVDAEKAVEIIKRMITDPDPFQRECMAFSLGEQYHPLTLELLKEALQDNENRVTIAALRALKRLEQQPKELFPEETRQEIRQILKDQEKKK